MPSTKTAILQPTEARSLSDGRTVSILNDESGERVELCSPDGAVEVAITLTEAGPVVRLSGARLEMTGTDSVTVKTRCFDVQASETARVHADGHLTLTSGLDTRMVAEGEVHVLGTMIWLN